MSENRGYGFFRNPYFLYYGQIYYATALPLVE